MRFVATLTVGARPPTRRTLSHARDSESRVHCQPKGQHTVCALRAGGLYDQTRGIVERSTPKRNGAPRRVGNPHLCIDRCVVTVCLTELRAARLQSLGVLLA